MDCPKVKNENTKEGIFQKVRYKTKMEIKNPVTFRSQCRFFSSFEYKLIVLLRGVRMMYIEINNINAKDTMFFPLRMYTVLLINSSCEINPNIDLIP